MPEPFTGLIPLITQAVVTTATPQSHATSITPLGKAAISIRHVKHNRDLLLKEMGRHFELADAALITDAVLQLGDLELDALDSAFSKVDRKLPNATSEWHRQQIYKSLENTVASLTRITAKARRNLE